MIQDRVLERLLAPRKTWILREDAASVEAKMAIDRMNSVLEDVENYTGTSFSLSINPGNAHEGAKAAYGHSRDGKYSYNLGLSDNGAIKLQIREIHPYDNADYVWGLCKDISDINNWVFIKKGKVVEVSDSNINNINDVKAVLNRLNKGTTPRIIHDSQEVKEEDKLDEEITSYKIGKSHKVEATVYDKSKSPLFYVVKYNKDLDTPALYIGEEGFADNIDFAQAFDEYSDAEDALDDFVDSLDLAKELGPELQEYIDLEKSDWEDEYEAQPKKESGLIDEWEARDALKKKCKIQGIYASKFEESDLRVESDSSEEDYSEEDYSADYESYENYSLFLFDDTDEYNDFDVLRGFTDYSTEDSCYSIFHADSDEEALLSCKKEPSKREVAVLCRRYDYDDHKPIYIKDEGTTKWRYYGKDALKEADDPVAELERKIEAGEYELTEEEKNQALSKASELLKQIENVLKYIDICKQKKWWSTYYKQKALAEKLQEERRNLLRPIWAQARVDAKKQEEEERIAKEKKFEDFAASYDGKEIYTAFNPEDWSTGDPTAHAAYYQVVGEEEGEKIVRKLNSKIVYESDQRAYHGKDYIIVPSVDDFAGEEIVLASLENPKPFNIRNKKEWISWNDYTD